MLLVRAPSIPLEVSTLRSYSPRRGTIALTPVQRGSIPPYTQYPSFTARTTGVSNPVRSLTFAPQRQFSSRKSPSPLVFFLISAYSPLHLGIATLSDTPGLAVPCHHGVKPRTFKDRLTYPPARASPNNSGQRLPPYVYRGCWRVVSRGFLFRYRQSFSLFARGLSSINRALQPEGRHHSRGVAPSDFRPLRKIPHCCLP